MINFPQCEGVLVQPRQDRSRSTCGYRGVTRRCHGMYFSTFWSLSVFLTFVVKLRLEKNISYGDRLEELSADKTPGLLKYMTFSKV